MSTPENEPDAAYHVGQFAQQHKFKLMLMISEMIYFFRLRDDDILLLFFCLCCCCWLGFVWSFVVVVVLY